MAKVSKVVRLTSWNYDSLCSLFSWLDAYSSVYFSLDRQGVETDKGKILPLKYLFPFNAKS